MTASRAVVLLSGGLDSATALAIARSDGHDCYGMSFAYGQLHTVELDAARRVADAIGVNEHRVVEIDLRAFGGSALTDSTLTVPKDDAALQSGIPVTYVPARNTVFLAYALAWAEVLDAGHIFIGVNAVDYSGYPDCRPEYIEAFSRMANLATRRAVEGQELAIHTPLISLRKSEIIQRGNALGVDYGMTHSCYDPIDGLACGSCDSCILRRRGFEEAGVADPTRYAK